MTSHNGACLEDGFSKFMFFFFYGCFYFALCSQQAMAKRPVSAVGNRRPITEYAKMAAAMGGHMRYKVQLHDGDQGGYGRFLNLFSPPPPNVLVPN